MHISNYLFQEMYQLQRKNSNFIVEKPSRHQLNPVIKICYQQKKIFFNAGIILYFKKKYITSNNTNQWHEFLDIRGT